jgi:hypothetical protein
VPFPLGRPWPVSGGSRVLSDSVASAQIQSDDSARPREGGPGGGIEPVGRESSVCFRALVGLLHSYQK